MMRFPMCSTHRISAHSLGRLKILAAIFIAFALSCGALSDAWAHRINVIARVEGDTIVVEGYVSGGAKVADMPVEVFDSSGKKALQGRTDAKGVYSFKLAEIPNVRGDLRILLRGGMGHDAEYVLPASELPGSSPPPDPAPPPDKKETGESAKPSRSVEAPDLEVVKSAVSKAVEEKIEPLVKMLGNQHKLLLEQQTKGPGIAEIVGGIGWILGIVGIAAYFKSRNRKER
jgi:nickel transport protein